MRIVSVNVHYQDNLGYQDYFLGRELKKMGHEVHFISSDCHFDYPDYERTVKHIIGEKYVGVGLFYNDYDVPVHRLEGTRKKLTGLIWLKGFKDKLIQLKPDFIISHGVFTYQSIRLLYLAKELRCPIVFDDHTTINLVRKTFSAKVVFLLFRILFAKKFLRIAHKIVGISDTCLDVLQNDFGLLGSKVKMIPLGTDTEIFRQNSELRSKFRKNHGIEDDEFLIVYTGKIYNLKNAHLIIDALNDSNVIMNQKVKILYVGDIAQEYEQFFHKKVDSSKNPVLLKGSVTIEGLAEVYNGADLCVWPDHLTTSTIDASACGCPIICSDYMPERVKYDNGFLVKAGNVIDLKEKLKMVLRDKTKCKEMGLNGIKYVNNELSWGSIAESFIAD
jgi:glycosyltransferase involved in cell wall biosynthesis